MHTCFSEPNSSIRILNYWRVIDWPRRYYAIWKMGQRKIRNLLYILAGCNINKFNDTHNRDLIFTYQKNSLFHKPKLYLTNILSATSYKQMNFYSLQANL